VAVSNVVLRQSPHCASGSMGEFLSRLTSNFGVELNAGPLRESDTCRHHE
jgi:hypothetical protein